MRFGTYYFLQAPPGRSDEEVIHGELLQIIFSEKLGYDTVWLTEHHFTEYGISVSPMALAAAIAAKTERIGIALAAAILPFHDPIRLAEEIAFVDVLSRGRLRVGIGRGNRPIEFAGYRVSQEENRERFGEILDIMVQAWTQERVSYSGRFFSIEGIPVRPKPYQKPHPPLMLVCISPETIAFAARRAWPMLNSILYGPIQQLIDKRDFYVTAMREAGYGEQAIQKALSSWSVSRHICVAPTDREAVAAAQAAELWYQQALARFLVPENIDAAPPPLQPQFRAIAETLKAVSWEKLLEETVVFGSPERVIDKVHEMQEIGVGELLCWMNFGSLPQETVLRSMRLFAEKVMPHFKQ
jgi:alkanesulfonate monooxygenase SsuD/methylene tetrahydromethanopterin reductase-like flavin-dependent oxidoreductase (luciferase family)